MSIDAKNIWRFLGASAAIVLLAAALNFAVDPLQLFRPARLFPAMYSADSRLQDAGLIRSQPFDTVFMGTSLAIHFRQSDFDRVMGVRSLKLAMTGSNSREQAFVLAAAMERRPKRVIWQMDDWIFRDAPGIDSDIYVPADLYRRNAKGIASYLFSGAMARESLWIAARAIPMLTPTVVRLTNGVMFRFSIPDVDDINVLRPDFDVAGFYNKKNALAAYRRITASPGSISEGYHYDAMVRNFERDATALIESNSNVTFDIYFAPYSILHFVAMRDASPATLKIADGFSAYAFQRLLQFPNVRLHDFRDVKDVTHDLDNYGDVIHHSPTVDLKILSWLAEGKHVVDRAAPLASVGRLKAQVEAYKVAQ
jgi:hypothetical protein